MYLYNPFFIFAVFMIVNRLKDMKNKIVLTNVERNEIIKLHKTLSIKKISKILPYSPSFIQKEIISHEFENNIKLNYPLREGFNLILVCKKTKKEFTDYKNQSGVITSHLLNIYPEIKLETNYIRKSIEYKTGKFWYDSYFTIDYSKIKETKKCSYCEWTTEDIDNFSGAYEKHLKSKHNITLLQHLTLHPEDKKYIKKEIYNDLVTCKICNKQYKTITNTHLKKHNTTQFEYKLKYGLNIISLDTKNKLSKSAIHTNKHIIRNFKTSKPENEIIEFLKLNNIDVSQGKRKILNGKEIDIISYDKKIGVEFNGCRYHTEGFGKHKTYHLDKTINSEKEGYKLIHIFEDEWEYKKEIVKSRLLNIFNKTNNKIHGRKCNLSILNDLEVKSNFLNENHIQGNTVSNITIIAKHKNEVVAMMCFNNKRNMNKEKSHNENIYELTRFTTKNNIIVNGIASKLLRFFIKEFQPEKIISFADIRWTPNSKNNLYTNLGFNLTKILKPEYWYYNRKYDKYKRFHKFGFGKSNIKKKFPNFFDNKKTEWEMMKELGFDRIWDCGKYKYEMNF